MDPTVPPLGVHHLHGDGHCQLRRHGTGGTSPVGSLLAAAPTLPAIVQRPVHVRAAVCRQVAQRVTREQIGVTAVPTKKSKKSGKVAEKAAKRRAAKVSKPRKA